MAAFTGDLNIFYDSTSLVTTQNRTVRLWEKWVPRSDTTGGIQQIKENIQFLGERLTPERARQYGYDVILSEYDCKKRTLRQLRWVIYSNEGEKLYELPDVVSEWSQTTADGLADRAMTVICTAARDR